ncbi:hypothetical protein [Hoeflea prorocentri]|uniref:SnoaL-like domain-containing protein n=1 Tax=Hoeflea prorocentri TaxID=1922333 RepID=A0A9X3UHF7_9HYPH|nr:hypothetical protein [Hoeflea prorocentri]MCY6380752.1 hypothetical protein [Hoeflea prorocentri]MDA5398552.1 hypothetical protein [Hoeflea prorocentri]
MAATSKILTTSLVAALVLSVPAIGAETMTTEEIKNGFHKHAALTQLHRWYLLYEEPKYGIDNQLDILDTNVTIKSGLGEATGHEQYAERVRQIPASWQNAHDVKSTDMTIGEDGSVNLMATITYLNKGVLEDGGVRSAELSYTTTLAPTDTVLPKFTSIEIVQDSDGTAAEFVSEYGNNRMRSLVHYWLALIEDPSRNPEPVKEILADDFSLNFSSGAITDFDGFKAWLTGPASAVVASTHKISDFSQESVGDNEYRVSMTFDWNGILPDQTEMTAKTRHTWLVVDDPSERFARIKTVDVEVIEPFRPKG